MQMKSAIAQQYGFQENRTLSKKNFYTLWYQKKISPWSQVPVVRQCIKLFIELYH